MKKYQVFFVKFENFIIKICANTVVKQIAFVENKVQILPTQQPLCDISNYYQQSGSLNIMGDDLLA